MRKWALAGGLIVAGFAPANIASGQVTDSSWTNGNGGVWGDAGNWDSLDFPDNGSDDQYRAFIDLTTGTPYDVVLNQPIAVNELTLNSADATLDLSGFEFAANTVNLLSGTFDFGDGTYIGGTMFGNGANIIGGGVVDGGLVSLGSSTLSVGQAGQTRHLEFRNGGTFTGNAVVLGGFSSSSSSIRFNSSDAVLDNANVQLGDASVAGDLFAENVQVTIGTNTTVQGRGLLRGNSSTDGDSFINQGFISANLTGRTLLINPDNFTNEAGGILRATNGGILRIGQTIGASNLTTWSSAGSIEVQDGSTVSLEGNYSSADVATLVRTGSNEVRILGSWDNAGNFDLDSDMGELRMFSGRIIGGTVTLNGGSFTGNGRFDGVTIDATSHDFRIGDNGGIVASMRFSNGATLLGDAIVSGGSGNGSSLIFENTDTILDNGNNIRLGGTDNVRRGQLLASNIELTIGSSVAVEGQGLIRGNSATAGDFVVNQGLIHANVGGRLLLVNPDRFTNQGTVAVSSGALLQLDNFVNEASGIIRLDDGEVETLDTLLDLGSGRLEGNGQVDGDFVSAGTISAGFSTGQIDFLDDVTLQSGGVVEIEIASLSDFDLLTVVGDLSLAGDIELSLIEGFELSTDQTFQFLEVAGTTSGAFDGLNDGDVVASFGEFDLRIDYDFQETSNVGLFTTSNVPEPSSAFIVLTGIGLIATRRRHS